MGFTNGVREGCGCVFGTIIGIIIFLIIVVSMCTSNM